MERSNDGQTESELFYNLYQGDCLKILPKVQSETVDAVIVDLPYGTTQNRWDSVIPLEKLWEEYLRVGKDNCVYIFTASQPFSSILTVSNLKMFKHEWIWIKNRGSNFANTVREPMKEHESILVFARKNYQYNRQMQPRTGGGLSRVNYGFNFNTNTENYGNFVGKRAQNLPELRVPSSWQKFNCEVGLHPTQKPVSLMEYLVKTYTNPGDHVLDNTMGSGTTGVACLNQTRSFTGIELDEKYFQRAHERLQQTITNGLNKIDNIQAKDQQDQTIAKVTIKLNVTNDLV